MQYIVGLGIAKEHYDRLKKLRDTVTRKQKELKQAYSASYDTVEKRLEKRQKNTGKLVKSRVLQI